MADEYLVSSTTLRKILGISQRRLTDLRRDEMFPSSGEGNTTKYVPRLVIQYLRDEAVLQEKAKHRPADDQVMSMTTDKEGLDAELVAEKVRKERAVNDLREKLVVPLSVVTDSLLAVSETAASHCNSTEGMLRREMPHMTSKDRRLILGHISKLRLMLSEIKLKDS